MANLEILIKRKSPEFLIESTKYTLPNEPTYLELT